MDDETEIPCAVKMLIGSAVAHLLMPLGAVRVQDIIHVLHQLSLTDDDPASCHHAIRLLKAKMH